MRALERLALLLVLASLVPGCTGGRGPGDGPIGIGATAPDFELPLLDGGSVRLKDLRGKVVFVNFWATWCPPCLEEMPSMEELVKTLDDPDFVMLSISVDEGGEKAIRDLLGERSWGFPILLDAALGKRRLSSRTGAAYGITGVPETFIIDRGGYIARHDTGPVLWTRPEELAYFRALLASS